MNYNPTFNTKAKEENYLVLISGPAASGKSTLVNRIKNIFSAYNFKPSECYIKLAEKYNIPLEKAFLEVKREEAEQYYCNICKSHKLVIGEQHLAIQHHKDSSIAISNATNGDILELDNLEEEYVPALSKEFIEQITNSGIKVLLILLEADPINLYLRAQGRYKNTGQYLRNKTLEDAIREVEAERKFFDELIRATNIDSCIIDTSLINEEEVVRNAVQKICEFKRPIRSTDEWTR